MNIAKSFTDIIVRILAVFIKNKVKRKLFREAGFAKIDKFFDFSQHLRIKEKFLASQPRPTILMVTNELSITGAPMVLLEAAKVLIKHGFSVLVVSFAEGPLRAEFEALGIQLVVGRSYRTDPGAIRRISTDFDLVLANTVLSALWIKQAAVPPERIIWWLHESEGIARMIQEGSQICEDALISASNVYVVSEYARSFIEKYCAANIIYLGIKDEMNLIEPADTAPDTGKVRIAVVGTFCQRKNQKLILEALALMSASSLARLEIVFVGLQKGSYYKSLLEDLQVEWPVVFTGEISDPTEKWRLFKCVDLFCVPSKDESCSLVVLEAFMLAKPVIISDWVGARYLVEDGKNGFIFPKDCADSLKDILEWVIVNIGKLSDLGQSARIKYLEKATLDQFEVRFIKIINSLLPDYVINATADEDGKAGSYPA